MVDISPAKALSVRVTIGGQLASVGKSKDKLLTFSDEVYILPKLDGVYAIKEGGKLRTRTMAPFRKELQERFKHLPDGVCGELLVRGRYASDSWAQTVSDVNKKDGATEAVLYMFDYARQGRFDERYVALRNFESAYCTRINPVCTMVVLKGIIGSVPPGPTVKAGEGETLEGLVLRPASMAYIPSRSTALRPFFMRIKGEETVDGVIVDFGQRMHNANEAKDTHDGKLRRHSFQANLKPTGLVGSIRVLLPTGKEVIVGTGFDMDQAADMWRRAVNLIGCHVELKRHEHVRETLSGEKSEQGAYVFLRLRPDKDKS